MVPGMLLGLMLSNMVINSSGEHLSETLMPMGLLIPVCSSENVSGRGWVRVCYCIQFRKCWCHRVVDVLVRMLLFDGAIKRAVLECRLRFIPEQKWTCA